VTLFRFALKAAWFPFWLALRVLAVLVFWRGSGGGYRRAGVPRVTVTRGPFTRPPTAAPFPGPWGRDHFRR